MNHGEDLKEKRDYFLLEIRKDKLNSIISKNRTKVNKQFDLNKNQLGNQQNDAFFDNHENLANTQNLAGDAQNKVDFKEELLVLRKELENAFKSESEEVREVI